MDLSTDKNNPYAYLEREQFTAEKFKIELKNLPKIYGIQELRKLINVKLGLNSSKIKPPSRNSRCVFICFKCEEDRQKALDVLKGTVWKGRPLLAHKAKPCPDPLVQKRQQKALLNQSGPLNQTIEERLKLSLIPLYKMPYKEQLELKRTEVTSVLKEYTGRLRNENPDLQSPFLDEQQQTSELEIRHCSVINGYRNKCSFTIGLEEGATNQQPIVGFRLGSYATDGTTAVAYVDNLEHIPDKMNKAIRYFQTFLIEIGNYLTVYNYETHTGHYRQLLMRTTPTELMLVVGIHPQTLPPATIKRFQQDLVDFFVGDGGAEAEVTSLYYEEIRKRASGANDCGGGGDPVLLWGSAEICPQLRNLRFKIGPEAFFQINTGAAEILYELIEELAAPLDGVTVLDVCCGTGTIGLSLAHAAQRVYGVEIVEGAVKNARTNAELNHIENSEFFHGKAEDLLADVCNRNITGPIVAILDPPRAGLHIKAIQQLRKCTQIERIVYVACNAKAAQKNWLELARPISKTMRNDPFVPVRAVAVDLFPYTKHCELVVSFKRFTV